MGKFYKTKESVKEYVRLSEGVSGQRLINKFRRFLTANDLILEIGSGPGTDWKILDEGLEVIGSDNSDEFIQHLNNKYPKGTFLKLEAAELKTERKFQGIYSNKVLHHLTNEELIHSIKRQVDILNPEGIICHSFWKGEGSEVFKGLFVNYHAKEDLKEFFQDYFEILSIEAYREFEENDSLLLIGRKK